MRIAATSLIVVLLAACATRNTPCEIEDATGRMSAAASTSANQDTKKWDVFTGAAVADSDGDALQNNTKTGVDVQSPTQATAGTIQFTFLPDVSKILSTTSPGEQAVLNRIAGTEQSILCIDKRLACDATLTPEEREYLEKKSLDAKTQLASLIDRLDEYSAKKIAAAQSMAPDLGCLRQILFNVQQVTTAGNEMPNISDAQAESIARVAEKGVEVSPVPDNMYVVTEPVTEEPVE